MRLAIQEKSVVYDVNGDLFEGFLAWDGATGPRPAVMVCHAWGGCAGFEQDKARMLAGLGYTAFAADVYGQGRRGGNPDANRALMEPLLNDRPLLQTRLEGSLTAMQQQDNVDATRCAAIGFCFGGLCVLDMARIGADVAGVVSFHGLFSTPGNTAGNEIGAKVLALHGWDDPMATPDQALALASELTAANADWQLHAYGGTAHAFSNPIANDPAHGLQYNPAAERRALEAMRNFLDELFGEPQD